MTTAAAMKPEAGEHAEYYERYVTLVPDGDVVSILSKQLEESLGVLRGIDETKANHSYAPDKWSIKQLLGHIIDTERIFAYRALRFARNDKQGLTGFDQDEFVTGANFDARNFADLVDEFEHVRKSTISLFKPLSDEEWLRRGTANDNEITVRALAFILAGHETHHMGILKTRYLANEAGASA
ncbi:MAG TPA: DinB family protein [Pyrinomonadaceae bacterium]|nr:DinB family protein [Pyrinomonadaceae bacterium]